MRKILHESIFSKTREIEDYIAQIKKEQQEKKDSFIKEFYDKRLAMFTNGLAKITIGSPTKTENREKRMRLDDALWAISAAQNGVLPGSGISLLQISCQLLENSLGNKIWKKTLEQPLKQILKNAGLEEQSIIKKIQQEEYNILYNVTKNQFELCGKSTVVDPYDVVAYAIRHACSIATMLLTTTSLVINEKKNASYIGTQESEL